MKIAAKVSYCNDYVQGKSLIGGFSQALGRFFCLFRFGMVHETRWIWSFEKRKPGYEYNVGLRHHGQRKGREKEAVKHIS